MKNWIKRTSVVAFFALSTFTWSSAIQPMQAHAIIGSVAWPLFPLVIVGVALEVSSVATGIAATIDQANGFYHRASGLAGISLSQFVLGLLFLDEQNGLGSLQKLSSDQAQQYGLTSAERDAYNQAVDNGDLEAIIQQASTELSPTSTPQQAREVMQNLLSSLDDDTHRGFNKIAQYLVTHR